MSAGKFTPGVWVLNRTMMDGKLLGWHIAATKHGSSLPLAHSDDYGTYRSEEEELANALVMNAAPKLLEVLQEINESFWLTPKIEVPGIANAMREKLQAAIAEATTPG